MENHDWIYIILLVIALIKVELLDSKLKRMTRSSNENFSLIALWVADQYKGGETHGSSKEEQEETV